MPVLAQTSGGQIRRPVKKTQNTSVAIKQEKKRTSAQKGSRKAGMSQAQKDCIIQNLISNMVYVDGGTFLMGSNDKEAGSNQKPVHQVTLSSFRIGKYEVTQEEWVVVMGSNPSHSKGARRPFECVNWDDIQEFIHKLNAMTGMSFRLPTEAEWEYAARGGKMSKGYKYAGSNNIGSVAWYDKNSGIESHDVGTKQPNELGLYDMSGNISELCQDWYGSYISGSQTNPTGTSSGSERVKRGGEFAMIAEGCTVSYRSGIPPDRRYYHWLGGRLAL